jgi:peptidyl-prolyl cis-trans isomerase C
MHYAILFVSFVFLQTQCLATPISESDVVARVNGESILRKDLMSVETGGHSHEEALNRLILYRLAVQEARKEQLEKEPEVQEKIDRVLYESFLKKQIAEKGAKLDPSEEQLRVLYEKMPMIRLRHLLLIAKTPAQRKKAEEATKIINEKIEAGADFKQLVLKYTQDASVNVAGDLDFRGYQTLPKFLYDPGIQLKKGAIIGPIGEQNTFHWIQLIDRKEFSSAPATYLDSIKEKVKRQRTDALLMNSLHKLKDEASIQVIGDSNGGKS